MQLQIIRQDITKMECDAIVNATNSALLPGGGSDAAMHRAAGPTLAAACRKVGSCPAGQARLTRGYALSCKYVIHTVGPIITDSLTKTDKELLSSCYRSCLELAEKNGVKSIAFCCISTGEFHFPNDKAAEIAVQTVKDYREQTKSDMEVIFNVFKDVDYEIYRGLLDAD